MLFVLEALTQENHRFWGEYVRAMKVCAKKTSHASEIEAAIKGFENALELADNPNTSVYVVYSTFDMSTARANDINKTINIQMCMTVTTSAKDRSCPAVTHMGIFRSPLLPINDDSDVPPAFASIFKTREAYHQFYRDKPAKGIALVLHSFAARAMTMMCQGRPLMWMITAPLPHMGSLLGDVGKIVAIDESEKKPVSSHSSMGMPMSSNPIGTRTLPSRVGATSSSSRLGAPMSSSSAGMPMLAGRRDRSTPPSPKGTPSSSSPERMPTLPKIGAPNPVNNTNSQAKGAPSSSSSPDSPSESSSLGAPTQVNHLTYAVDHTNPMKVSLEITCAGFRRTWNRMEYPWLFELAFNPSHLFKATFTDFRVLAELHQDIVIMGTEHAPPLTVITPGPGTPAGRAPHSSLLGTVPPNQGAAKGMGTVATPSTPPK
ncbi:hypothetical protein [Rhodanobacter sp. C06]|uniref:hypothetical protein n=1 Tax=Rhodanobacter sp. C06 TaxID=1945854 RepID=UPI0011157DC2|nr:hypothetical protein [Rhodanobacter sp. C06]